MQSGGLRSPQPMRATASAVLPCGGAQMRDQRDERNQGQKPGLRGEQ